jgi:cytochrome c biogenesis protein CcdA
MMAPEDQSLKELLKGLVDEISLLIRQELRLAQAETSEKIGHMQNSAAAIVAGLLLAFSALLVLLQALVIALANVVPPWLAAIIVAVVVAIIAFILLERGRAGFKASSIVPKRTIKSVKDDKELVMEKVK